MNERFQLTENERLFIDSFCHETTTAREGTAVRWLNAVGVKNHEIYPLEKIRSIDDPAFIERTLHLEPKEFTVPWVTAAELRDRIVQAQLFLKLERGES